MAALAAALMAGQSIGSALAGDVKTAAALALGFAGLLVLEALLVHCGAWRDAADIFTTVARRAAMRLPTAFACVALALWIHPLSALAATAVAVLAFAAGAAFARGQNGADAAATSARTAALTDFEIARASPRAVKAAGLEMAFARRVERTLGEALPQLRRALLLPALQRSVRIGAGEAAALSAGLVAYAAALTPTEIATLALLAARAPDAFRPRAPEPGARLA